MEEINAVHTATDIDYIRNEVHELRAEVTGLKRKLDEALGRKAPNSNGYRTSSFVTSSSASANARQR